MKQGTQARSSENPQRANGPATFHPASFEKTAAPDPLEILRQYALPVLMAWISLGVYFWTGFPAWQELFSQSDSSLWIRHFFGQFNHTNGVHLALNLMAMAVVQWGLGQTQSASNNDQSSNLCLSLSLCFVPLYLAYVEPLSSYAGLSGALHGWFTYLLLVAFTKDCRLTWIQSWPVWVLAVGFFAKMTSEWINGNEYSDLIAASVATQAHRAGAVFGLIFFCIVVLIRPKETHQSTQMI